jgi:ABC-type ATPase involved in cell division
MTIKTAHAKTCRWLLKNEQYLSWLDMTKVGEHHGFLWIKGKAGTGKLTLMKFALVDARKTMTDHIHCNLFLLQRARRRRREVYYRDIPLAAIAALGASSGAPERL